MAQQYSEISDRLADFIARQHVFFVATAARDGRVNVSPKGLDSLRVLGPNRVVWLNGTGSGNETAAHLLDTNRITLMFCSFERQPLILRLYGAATEVQPDQPAWAELESLFPPMLGARQMFDVDVELVQTSCGYGVPFMEFAGERPLMHQWRRRRVPTASRPITRKRTSSASTGSRRACVPLLVEPADTARPRRQPTAATTLHGRRPPSSLVEDSVLRCEDEARALRLGVGVQRQCVEGRGGLLLDEDVRDALLDHLVLGLRSRHQGQLEVAGLAGRLGDPKATLARDAGLHGQVLHCSSRVVGHGEHAVLLSSVSADPSTEPNLVTNPQR